VDLDLDTDGAALTAQLVDVPNLGVTAILNRDVFQPEPK